SGQFLSAQLHLQPVRSLAPAASGCARDSARTAWRPSPALCDSPLVRRRRGACRRHDRDGLRPQLGRGRRLFHSRGLGQESFRSRHGILPWSPLERTMTATGLWQDIGAGENLFTRILRLVFLLIAGVVFFFLATLPLTWAQQAVLGALSIGIALVVGRGSDSYLVTLTLMMLSMFCTLRYGYWRMAQVVRYFHDPASHVRALDVFFILCLLSAEVYAFGILFLGYFQTIWPLRRAPVPLPDNPEQWPHIDVLIPTVNEPLDVVRYTALGALNMDWPVDKLHVCLLDDGRRPEFEQFAREAGIGYRTRPDNTCAKAGNINAALKTVSSPFV